MLVAVFVVGAFVVVVREPLAPTIVVVVAVVVGVITAAPVVDNPLPVVQTLTVHRLTLVGDPGVMTITGAKLMPVWGLIQLAGKADPTVAKTMAAAPNFLRPANARAVPIAIAPFAPSRRARRTRPRK